MSQDAHDEGRPRARRRLVAVFFGVYCLVVCSLIVRAYPPLWQGSHAPESKKNPITRKRSSSPIQLNENPGPLDSATFTYRGGASRSGVVADAIVPLSLAPVWSVADLNVGIHSAIKASPAVDETGVYLGTDASWFYSFGLDGHLRWRFYVANALHGIHGTAALDASSVYFGAYNGCLYALRKEDGAPYWITPLGDVIGSSPVILLDDIYISVETSSPANGFVARLDRRTGNVLWRSDPLGAQAHSSPVVDSKRGLAFVGANNNTVFGIDLESGHIRFRRRVDGDIKGTGVLAEDRIVMLTMPGTLYALDPANGNILWSVTLPGEDTRVRGSPSWDPISDVIIAASAHHISGVNRRTGTLQWTQAVDAERINTSPVIVQAEKIGNWVVWMQCSETSLCAFDPATGTRHTEITLPGQLTSVPTVFRHSIFFSFDEGSGLWRFD